NRYTGIFSRQGIVEQYNEPSLSLAVSSSGDNVTQLGVHTFEHMFATYVRNSDIADDVIYFGPMGCQTGFYLLVRNADNSKVLEVTKKVLSDILQHSGDVFGNSEIECGNYRTLNLDKAKLEAKSYLDILNSKENTFLYN
ncbi:MAG: S-ribosylhomocysteine lyase, partial [Clostridia bacterium]|nr:S-ribosylhomocysteine lyase [Clostridia bacterium]